MTEARPLDFAGAGSLARPLVGVLHLEALPGTPRGKNLEEDVLARVLEDASLLVEGGFDAILLENYGDVPFCRDRVGPETVAAMTRIACEVATAHPSTPVGINVLRCDPLAALSVAAATGTAFIRSNVHAGAVVTDQGIIEGRARETLALRRRLRAEEIQIWADVRVKHAAPLAPRPLEEEARELADRSLADVLLVTGPSTGRRASLEELERVRGAVSVPVLVASGVDASTVREVLEAADGCIVGSALCLDGRAGSRIDPERVRAFVRAARG